MDEIRQDGLKYDASVIGTSGLKQFGGYINEEFQKELRGLNGSRVFREMADNDPVVGAILFAVTMLIRQVEWSVQAADDTPEGEAAKEFVEEVIADMSTGWHSVLAEICSMFVYGFAPMEIVWKKRGGMDAPNSESRSAYDDGKIGIRTLSLRAQNTIPRWEIDPTDGSVDGLWQQPYDRAMVAIPIEKLLLFRTTEERNNPEGRSLLRNAYRPWFFKKRIEEIEAIGLERDLAGLPIAHIPAQYLTVGADANDKAVASEYKRLIRSIKRDTSEGLVLPSTRDQSGNLLFEVKLLSTSGKRQFDTTQVLTRYDKAIATSVLADFVFLGQGSTGSFALSSNKTELFATAIGAFTKSIADVINRHLLPRLWKLNGLDFEIMPSMVPGDLEAPDLGALGAFIQQLSASGAPLFPDRELENALRTAANLPLAPEDGSNMETPVAGDPNADTETDPAAGQKKDPKAKPKAAPKPAKGAQP
ncbi:hypothetical protein UFOVP119_40 [uncultured Caudovirales phage]|uniref:Portal protein n=1 Tax=uncultured Caudovirales phage TaxID=2100421 RepID=A0A6J5LAZ7_9CAUD|nr:hypothetical protein UFOVP119_40 [uncultured Caudovirales phage]